VLTLAHEQQLRITVDALQVEALTGPLLLAAIDRGPGLTAHRIARGEVPSLRAAQLTELADRIGLRGHGGAGFPFGDKLRAVRGARRTPVVVNVCEGEPVSAKDSVLTVLAPHLVLDGAVVTARALSSHAVHLVVPAERPAVADSIRAAIAERDRREDRARFEVHAARPGFVSGQARAVVELIEGRENAPVTALRPVTTSGLHRRPTLLSNAETFAHVAAAALRAPPGVQRDLRTTLLTLDDGAGPRRVLEVPVGTPWPSVLGPAALARPVLVGGFHGRWAPAGALTELTVSRDDLSGHGLTLGAGVVLVPRGCPLVATARIVAYLADQSAGRCGPCRNGLPALADACWALVSGAGPPERASRVARMVDGRGACAHPDGTAGLVRSALAVLADEVLAHAHAGCTYDEGGRHRAP
jgi:NADH:ubiquinone oxidoreductase subunit F (NADH-binding)